MIKEGSFPNANKFNEISQKKEYSEEEITEKISQGVDLDNDFAFYLLESGKQDLLIENLDKFQGLGQDIAFKLVELEKASDVIDNIDKFSNINQSGLALKLFEIGHGDGVAIKLEKFQNLNKEVAIKLLEANQLNSFMSNIEIFSGLDQEIFLKILNVKESLPYSSIRTDEKKPRRTTKRPRTSVLINNLYRFNDLNYSDVVSKLLESGSGYLVADNLEKFPGLNHQEIAQKLLESGRGSLVVDNLEKFQGLNHQEIALKLIEFEGGGEVANNLEKFRGINYQEIALKLIEFEKIELVTNNLHKFQLSPQKFYQAIKEKYPEYISKVETKIPKLAYQLVRSVELLLDVLNIREAFSELEKNIDENSFLLEALEDSPRYGSKLILKYQEFDKTAKNNIQELFGNEAEILKENPNLDKDSVEFRSLMQEKLTSHANNKRIQEEFKSHNVNTKEWLDYDKQIYFTLGESEDVKFSDQIKTPITRIKETLNKYQDSIINVLSDYKKELQESFIPNPESEELKQKIAEQKARIATETDEKKIQGMQRGLTSLKAKDVTLKPASVWSKVQSDIFRLKSMIDNIFKFHDACVATETKIDTVKDRKELIKEKGNLDKHKSQLRDNFKEFEQFFESYETKLQELIIPSLGQERTNSLLQEIEETIGEELNHYDTDKNTLKNIFNEKPEDENKLNGREMKISISSRSTQDLYLGNYCPCCICIESDYHGAQSPIADYVTDLGMQNIVVYDEKTNVPVVACWTFIGENVANSKPIMVIDNIEANTGYTSSYPEQLKEIISRYINDYARAVNIKTIIQGEHNNDLVVFELSEVDRKLGGKYNRTDGYFLEAERDEDEDEYEDNDWEDEGNNNQ